MKAVREGALEVVAEGKAFVTAGASVGGGGGQALCLSCGRSASLLHCENSVNRSRRQRDDHREHDGQKSFVQHFGRISASGREARARKVRQIVFVVQSQDRFCHVTFSW